MLDRNFIISLALAFALILGYNAYYQTRFGHYLEKAAKEQSLTIAKKKAESKKPKPEEAARPAAAPSAKIPAVAAADSSPVDAGAASGGGGQVGVVPAPETAAPSIPPAEDWVEVNTGSATARISAKGAVLVSYKLSGYHDEKGMPVNLIMDGAAFEAAQKKQYQELKEKGKLEEFVPVAVYPTLGLKFPKPDFSSIINSAVFGHDAQEARIDISQGGGPRVVAFEHTEPTGVTVRKKYTFYPNEYFFDFSVEVASTAQWGDFAYSLVWFGLNDDESEKTKYLSYHRPMLKIGAIYAMDDPDPKKASHEYKGDIVWTALTHKYYAVIGSAQKPAETVVRTNYIDKYNTTLEWERKSGSAETIRFYLGPKRHDILSKYTDGRGAVIDYGWFNLVAQPLFWMMDKLQKLTGNWGWAIVILTVSMKTILFPLSQKSFRSMKRMQRLQPQMQKIQELYKNDKEKMNQELMAFYRDNKVNPMGGCMPMFLQIPIFFALYKVLYESIELKGVPWILWITDLTQKDPYYVTPLIMGATMFLQQWMTPSTGDPTQRQVMLIMPVMFTFMFLSFPSGLILYWMVNNVLSIIQQWIINRESSGEETPRTKPA